MRPAPVVGPLESAILAGAELATDPRLPFLGFALAAVPRTRWHCHDPIAGWGTEVECLRQNRRLP